MPVCESQLQEAGIVVAITVADGCEERRRLAVGTKGAVDGIVAQGPAEHKSAGVGDASPRVERVRGAHITDVVRYERGRTACGATHAGAIVFRQRTFEERLNRQRIEIGQICGVRRAVYL